MSAFVCGSFFTSYNTDYAMVMFFTPNFSEKIFIVLNYTASNDPKSIIVTVHRVAK
jgi:hypothetical protein